MAQHRSVFPSDTTLLEVECADCYTDVADQFDDLVFLRFLKSHTCYDVLPTSNKIVVLDTELNVSCRVDSCVHD